MKVILIPSDRSILYDTVDTGKLVSQLSEVFGLLRTVHQQIQSYLEQNSQFANFGGILSGVLSLLSSVSKGSFLDCLVFTTIHLCPLVMTTQ